MGPLPGHWMLAMSTHSREPPPFWMVCYDLPRTVTGCWKTKQGHSAKLRVLSHNNRRVAQDSTVPVEPPTVPSMSGPHLPSQGLVCAFQNRSGLLKGMVNGGPPLRMLKRLAPFRWPLTCPRPVGVADVFRCPSPRLGRSRAGLGIGGCWPVIHQASPRSR